MNISHLTNRTLGHRRPAVADDGAGGGRTTMVDLDPIAARVSQGSAAERLYSSQAQADHNVPIYVDDPGADVRKDDELYDVATGEVWRVAALIRPSKPKYLRADCELIETRGSGG